MKGAWRQSRGARMLRMELLNGDQTHEPKSTKEVGAGQAFSACRCWHSKQFPQCDGSHNAYNKATGDHVGPLVLKAVPADK
ncbi:hypothetical protein CDCA_CDCA11G3282 [Cyanidium caldarium]|uniref:Iron-binding zinc finger CDGSH type domain-containing protein n=1 Tax=Cyanidium caldarium TaxID=2771 RepID=A0AAV9IY50_CYACA|nr:hypothetical protein CDCA_CDCA11G3282 [Cyanidium caldarium]